MKSKTVDVIITVHVEEHPKFYRNLHFGHECFFKLLLDRKCKIPLTLLIQRIREVPDCLKRDRPFLDKIKGFDIMEIGLHVHPAVSKFTFKEQDYLISREYHKLEKKCGIRSKTFSGGHWCINNDTIKVIKKLGITADASIVPGRMVMAYNGSIEYYTMVHTTPYWISHNDLSLVDPEMKVLEIPLSVDKHRAPLDIANMKLWMILRAIEELSCEPKERHYLHLTFHSYDMLFFDGTPNFVYDKLQLIIRKLYDYFGEVRLLTCSNYYRTMRKERTNESYN